MVLQPWEKFKVMVAIGLNMFLVWKDLHGILLLFPVSYFHLELLRITDDGLFLFPRELQICHYWIVKSTGKFLQKFLCPLLLGREKKLISRISKKPDSSFWKYIFLQKINVGRKKTISQWLISFRKITAQ